MALKYCATSSFSFPLFVQVADASCCATYKSSPGLKLNILACSVHSSLLGDRWFEASSDGLRWAWQITCSLAHFDSRLTLNESRLCLSRRKISRRTITHPRTSLQARRGISCLSVKADSIGLSRQSKPRVEISLRPNVIASYHPQDRRPAFAPFGLGAELPHSLTTAWPVLMSDTCRNAGARGALVSEGSR